MKHNIRQGLIDLRAALAANILGSNQTINATTKIATGMFADVEKSQKYETAPAQPAFKEGASAEPLATFRVIIGAAEPNNGNNKITQTSKHKENK